MNLSPSGLREWRETNGFTLQECAKIFDIAVSTYLKYEDGSARIRPPKREIASQLLQSILALSPLLEPSLSNRPIALRGDMLREWQRQYNMDDFGAAAFLGIPEDRLRWYASGAAPALPEWLSKVVLFGSKPSDVFVEVPSDVARYAAGASVKAPPVQKNPVGRPSSKKPDDTTEYDKHRAWFMASGYRQSAEGWADCLNDLRLSDNYAWRRLKNKPYPRFYEPVAAPPQPPQNDTPPGTAIGPDGYGTDVPDYLKGRVLCTLRTRTLDIESECEGGAL